MPALLAMAATATAQDEVYEKAQELQRSRGYDAALEFLEPQLTHRKLAVLYADLCAWAGQEERGLQHLARCTVPPHERIQGELYLLSVLQRYDEVARRARDVMGDQADWAPYIKWAEDQAAQRRRLRARTRRGMWVAVAALAVLLAGSAALFRLAPRLP